MLQQVFRMRDADGNDYDVPEKDMAEFSSAVPNASRVTRHRDADGNDYDVPEKDMAEFSSAVKDAKPVTKFRMDDGRVFDADGGQLSKFADEVLFGEGSTPDSAWKAAGFPELSNTGAGGASSSDASMLASLVQSEGMMGQISDRARKYLAEHERGGEDHSDAEKILPTGDADVKQDGQYTYPTDYDTTDPFSEWRRSLTDAEFDMLATRQHPIASAVMEIPGGLSYGLKNTVAPAVRAFLTAPMRLIDSMAGGGNVPLDPMGVVGAPTAELKKGPMKDLANKIDASLAPTKEELEAQGAVGRAVGKVNEIAQTIGTFALALRGLGKGFGNTLMSAEAGNDTYVSLYDMGLNSGLSEDDARKYAAGGGAVATLGTAALGAISLPKFMQMGVPEIEAGASMGGYKDLVRAAMVGNVKRYLVNTAAAAGWQGGIMGTESFLSTPFAQKSQGKDVDWTEAWWNGAESAAEGFGVGLFMGGMSFMDYKRSVRMGVEAEARMAAGNEEGRTAWRMMFPDGVRNLVEKRVAGKGITRGDVERAGFPGMPKAERNALADAYVEDVAKFAAENAERIKVERDLRKPSEPTVGPAPYDEPAKPAKGEVVPVEPEPVKAPEKPVEPVKPPEKPVETPPAPVTPPEPPAETPKNGPVSVPPPEGATTPPPPAEPPQPAEAPKANETTAAKNIDVSAFVKAQREAEADGGFEGDRGLADLVESLPPEKAQELVGLWDESSRLRDEADKLVDGHGRLGRTNQTEFDTAENERKHADLRARARDLQSEANKMLLREAEANGWEQGEDAETGGVRWVKKSAAEVPAKTETGGNQGDAAQQLSAVNKGKKPHAAAKPPPEPKRTFVDDFGKTHEVNEDISRQLRQEARSEVNLICNTKNKTSIETARKQVKRVAAAMTNDDLSASLAETVREERRNTTGGKASDILLEEAKSRGLEVTEKPKEMPQPGEWIVGRVDGDSSYAVAGRVLSADARGIVVQYYGGHNKVRAGKTVGEETFKALVPTDAVDLAIRDPSRPAKVSARSPAVAAADDFIVRNTTLSRDGAVVANDDINHQGEVKPPPRTEDEPRKPFAKPLKIVDAPAAAKEMAGHASQDVARKALTGVHVEKGLMVATDGRHMVIAPAPKGWTDGEYGADGKPVGDDRVYPNWRQVVPDVKKVGYAKIGTVANGDAATDAVDFASALRKKVVAVTKYDNDGPTVAIGDATCDPSYVSDILGTMFRLGAKSVDVWHRDGKSPVVFKGRNADGEITSVLMPLRSNSESAAERGFTHVRMPLEAPKPKNKGKGKKAVQAAKALGSPDAASPLRPAPKGAELVQGEFDGMGGVTESVSEATRQAFAANPRTKSWEILAEPKTVSDVKPSDIAIETPLVPVGNDGATVKPQSNNAVRNSVKDVFRSFGVCENAADKNKVVFPGNSAGKMMSQSGADVAALAPHMKQLFESAVPAWYEPETTMDGHTPHPDVAGYRHYLNKFRTTDGSEFYIRFTVREGKGKGGFKGVHAATVSDVKIYESKNAEPTILVDETSRRLRAFTDNKLSDFLSTVNAKKTQKTPDGRAIRPADLAPASEAKDPAADPQNAARNPGALRDPAFVRWAKSKGRAPTPFARRAYDAAQLRAAVPLYRNVFPDMNIVIHDKVEDPAKWTADHPDGTQKQISGIYTGSAADYEKPSLHAVGTGEGSQVYGWGLYGSTVRGVAEGYARPNHLTPEGLASSTLHQYSNDRDAAIAHLQKYVDSGRLSFRALTKEEIARTKGAIEILKSHAEKSGYLYEQTFFTNRAEGDESHLLKWYEPVSEEQLEWIFDQATKEGLSVNTDKGGRRYVKGQVLDYWDDGREAYHGLKTILGSPQAASEFLARAGIDGVKYPVDSYGGKGVKDGDKAGWNYVSFRDDNIRVDHKWTDGEQLKMIVDPKSGETLGWYTPQFKEVHLNPGATVETLAHEMLHAAQDWAKANSPKLAKTLDDIARDCPPKLRQRILRAYGVVSPETIMKEWGAFNFMGGPEGGKGRGGEALRDELAKRENAAWLGRFWSAAKDAWRDMAAKMGGNRIDLDAIDSKTPQEAMDFLARAFAEGGTVGKANPPGKSVSPAIDMTKPLSFGEKWDVNLHDYRSPLKWLRDEMAKRGSSFADDTDFYEAARLQKGYDQAAVNDADRRLKEYTGKLKKLGVKHEEVVEFMQAQAAKDRNAMIREKFGREDGSGMTDAEAAATLKAFDDAGKGDALREISDFLLDMQREGLQYRVETGLLSAEDAQRMADREPFHVPFRSAVDPETGDYVQWGSDKALEKAEFKEAKGRKTLADDVVGWMFSEFIDAHTRGNENRIRKMVADAMRLNTKSGVGKILKGARKQSAYDFSAGEYKTGADGDGLTGDKAKAAIVDDPRFRESRKNGDGGRKNVLAFKEGGRTHYIEFAEGERGERLQAAVNGRDLKSMGKRWSRGMRFWSSTATEWAPTFALRNFAADNIDVFGNYIGEHGIVKGSESYARHLKNAAALTPAITRYIATGEIPQGAGGEWIRRYEQSGGLIAGYASEGYGEITSKIDAEIAKGGRSKGAVIARNVALAVPHAVAAVNRYAELLTRVSAFRTQCENGMTDHKAALWSRESTVDFNEKGNFTGITNGLWMFSNSTLGASARQLKSIFKSKYGWQTVAAFAGYGIVEAILEILMNGDDEEREAKGEGAGKDVSEYTRANSLYWRRGGKVYRIPFHAGPFSYLKYAGNCAARVAFGKMKPEDAAKELSVEALSQLFHYTGVGDVNMQSQSGRFADDAATFAGTAAPSLAQPLVQGAFNIDYAGRSIYNEGFPGDRTPRSAQGRRTTPEWTKDAAAWLNEATRSEGHETGYIDLPPEIVKMAGEAVGKNLLRDVMNAGTVCAMAFGDEKYDVRNVPVARDFVRAVDGNDRRYNDARKEYEANADYLKKHAREMSAEERRAYVEKFPHAAFVAKGKQRLDGLETEIRRLRKMEDGFAFVKGKAVPREWPEERLEAFRKRRRELQALFLKEMGM